LPSLLRSGALAALALPLLSGCCGYFYYECAPQQPAAITAHENVQSFVSARDQAAGLLASANAVLTPSAVASITARYDAAATAANAWIDYAQGALRGSGSYDAAQSAGQLDTVVAEVRAFADAVQAAAVPGNMKVPFNPPPPEAVLDDLTGAPPIAAAAEYTANGVSAGVDAIKAAQGPVSMLDAQRRSAIADTIAGAHWPAAQEVLSAPSSFVTR
jgi:hypothetical protein